MKPIFTKYLLAFFMIALSISCTSETEKPDSVPEKVKPVNQALYDSIEMLDRLLFDAFNAHNVDSLMSYFTNDLEFFHDNGGLAGYEQTKENFSKLFSNNNDIRRKLVAGSLEVYPIKDYGAIHIASQEFCHTEKGKPDCGVSKFVMVWKNENGNWKISRVVSYAH